MILPVGGLPINGQIQIQTDLPASVTSPKHCCYNYLSTLGNIIVVLGKIVRQHTKHVRRSSSFSVKLRNSFLGTSGIRIVLILLLLTVEYGAWFKIVCVRRQIKKWQLWDRVWWTLVVACHRALWTMLLINGEKLQACVNEKYTFWTLAIVTELEIRTGCADKLNVALDCATATVMCNLN